MRSIKEACRAPGGMSSLYGKFLAAAAAFLFITHLGARAEIVINEIHYNPEERGPSLEYIELLNTGSEPVDLSHWHLIDAVEFAFPTGTKLAPNAFAIVSASPERFKDHWGITAFGPWKGKLSNKKDEVILCNAEGDEMDNVKYRSGFPWPTITNGGGASMELLHPELDNSIAGNWRASVLPTSPKWRNAVFVPAASKDWKFFRGTREPSRDGKSWRGINFADARSWQTGRAPIGYADGDDNTVISNMRNKFTSIYLRKTFEISGDDLPSQLLLRVYSDDGAIVWINGKEVARLRALPGHQTHRATASSNHEAAWEEISLGGTERFLRNGTNLIAVHGLNGTLDSSDFSIDIELKTPPASETTPVPTPGKPNSTRIANATQLPPAAKSVTHSPVAPKPGEPVTITAQFANPDNVAKVVAKLQIVNPGDYIRWQDPRFEKEWESLPMQKTESGDYAVEIPGVRQAHRRLIRYRIVTTGSNGVSVMLPHTDDPQRNFAWFCYGDYPGWSGADRPGRSPRIDFSSRMIGSMPAIHLIAREREITDCQ